MDFVGGAGATIAGAGSQGTVIIPSAIGTATSSASATATASAAAAAAAATHTLVSSDNGPILYTEPNRTSAIDDIRSVVIYVFIITIFLCFFLILPGIRNEKFPTFLCITTSLIVTSIILVALFGTTWHVGDASISAAYKAFSKDKIQGELSVKIGLQSVNITLRAHRYYTLHAIRGPMIMLETSLIENGKLMNQLMEEEAEEEQLKSNSKALNKNKNFADLNNNEEQAKQPISGSASTFISPSSQTAPAANGGSTSAGSSLADELLGERTSDGASVDTELEAEEVFGEGSKPLRKARSSNNNNNSSSSPTLQKRSTSASNFADKRPERLPAASSAASNLNQKKFILERVNIDINYNERFYWIGPNQMRQEHQSALERGLPYPILTVVEYLSQDDAGFNWSRQYRSAGYYSYIILWLSLCCSALMFFLHCAAPKYGIYTMQILGCLLLFTNLTYATLVPRGEQKLVIPFEGQSLVFKFGWNFWLVMIGGGLSLFVGTLIVIVDSLFPNFIFTTILDVDFDSRRRYLENKQRSNKMNDQQHDEHNCNNQGPAKRPNNALERPIKPPFLNDKTSSTTTTTTTLTREQEAEQVILGQNSKSLVSSTKLATDNKFGERTQTKQQQQQQQHSIDEKHLFQVDQKSGELFTKLQQRITTSDSESIKRELKKRRVGGGGGGDTSVLETPQATVLTVCNDGDDITEISDTQILRQPSSSSSSGNKTRHHHYAKGQGNKNNLKGTLTDQLTRRQSVGEEEGYKSSSTTKTTITNNRHNNNARL